MPDIDHQILLLVTLPGPPDASDMTLLKRARAEVALGCMRVEAIVVPDEDPPTNTPD